MAAISSTPSTKPACCRAQGMASKLVPIIVFQMENLTAHGTRDPHSHRHKTALLAFRVLELVEGQDGEPFAGHVDVVRHHQGLAARVESVEQSVANGHVVVAVQVRVLLRDVGSGGRGPGAAVEHEGPSDGAGWS